MNYARDADEFAPVCCIDGLQKLVASLVAGVEEERGPWTGRTRDQAPTLQIVRDRMGLMLRDVQVLGECGYGERLRRVPPEDQQRLEVRHAVYLIHNELIDADRFFVHRPGRTHLISVYDGTIAQLSNQTPRPISLVTASMALESCETAT